jgi:hypothetical protein
MLAVAMRARRAHRFQTALRLVLALFALAAGQSVAARAEVAAPRVAIVCEVRGPRSEVRVVATVAPGARSATVEAHREEKAVEPEASARRVPLYLLHCALLR